MKWLRWYHGCAADPKWGRVARRSGQTRERVLFVWAMILEDASQRETRDGSFEIEADDIADVLNCETEDVTAILAQMADIGVIDERSVATWAKHQPNSDDEATKKRRQREQTGTSRVNAKACPDNVPGHGGDSPVLDTDRDLDKEVVPPSPIGDVPPRSKNSRGSRLPDDWTPDEADSAFAAEHGVDANIEAEKFRDHWHSKAGRGAVWLDWHAKWRSWVRDAKEINTKRNGAPKRDPTAGPVQRRVPTEAEYRTATRKWKSDGHWPQYLGPRPDMQSTRVPKHIRQEFGL